MFKFFKRVTKDDLIDRLFADVGNLYKELASKQVQIVQLYQSCDELHAAVRELRSAKQVQQDAAAEDWRPTADAAGMVKQAKQVIVDLPDEPKRKSSSSEHFARMSVRTKGTIENRLVDIANDRMRGIGCADVYALKRRINEGSASLCISDKTRCVKRSKKSKQTRTYAGDMRFYDKRTVNTKGNNPEKTYSFRCEEERLLLMAYFDIHRVPYTTGRKQ